MAPCQSALKRLPRIDLVGKVRRCPSLAADGADLVDRLPGLRGEHAGKGERPPVSFVGEVVYQELADSSAIPMNPGPFISLQLVPDFWISGLR